MDERKFYYYGASLLRALRGDEMPAHSWAKLGKEIKKSNRQFVLTYNIGFQGYFAGPQCYFLDKLALSDPLRSHLPSNDNWRIGHYERIIPKGYPESIVKNDAAIKDPGLNSYYKKLIILTKGDLFDYNRVVEIIKFNLGSYQHLLENYIQRIKYHLNTLINVIIKRKLFIERIKRVNVEKSLFLFEKAHPRTLKMKRLLTKLGYLRTIRKK